MANNNIQARISLVGGEDVKRALADIGRAGEDLTKKLRNADFSVLSELEKKLRNADFGTKASKDLTDLNEKIGLTKQQSLALVYTFNDITASLASGASPFTIMLQQGGQVTQAFGGLGGTIATLLPYILRLAPAFGAVGVAIAGIGFLKLGADAAKAAVDLGNLAEKAGISVAAFQKFADAGAALRGLKPEDVASGFERLRDAGLEAAKAQREVTSSAKNTPTAFEKLGVSFENFSGSAPQVESAAAKISNALAKMPEGINKALIVNDLKKALGADFVAVLLKGQNEIDKLGAKLRSSSDYATDLDVKLGRNLQQSLATLTAQSDAAKKKLSDLFIPATIAAAEWFHAVKSGASPAFESLKSIVDSASKTLLDFFLILLGDKQAAENSPVIAAIIGGFITIGKVASFIGDSITKFFKLIGLAGQVVAKVFDDVFVKQLGADSSNAIGVLAKVGEALVSLGGIIGAFLVTSAIFNPWVAGLLLVIAASEALYLAWDKLKNIPDLLSLKWQKATQDVISYYERAKSYALATIGQFKDAAAASISADEAAAESKKLEGAISEAAKNSSISFDELRKNFNNQVKGIGDYFKQQISSSSNDATNEALANLKKLLSGGEDVVAQAADTTNNVVRIIRGGVVSTAEVSASASDNLVRVIKGGQSEWIKFGSSIDSVKQTVQSTTDAIANAKPTPSGIVQSADEITRAFEAAKASVDQSILDVQNAISLKQQGAAPEASLNLGAPQAAQSDQSSQQLVTPFSEAKGQILSILDDIQAAAAVAAGWIVEAFAPIGSALPQPFQSASVGISSVLAGISDLVSAAFQALQNAIASAAASVELSIASIISSLEAAVAKAQQLAAAAQQAAQQAASAGGGGGGGGGSGFASGGPVFGPGTSTSDSIPAWLSTGEFVIRAAAVKHYGKSLFAALNGLSVRPRFNLGRVGFASGGLVSSALGNSTFAPNQSGGLHPLTLVVGGQKVGGLAATRSAAAQLTRLAARKSATSAGPAPGWEV